MFYFGTGHHCVALSVLELNIDQAGPELTDPPASVSLSAGMFVISLSVLSNTQAGLELVGSSNNLPAAVS